MDADFLNHDVWKHCGHNIVGLCWKSCLLQHFIIGSCFYLIIIHFNIAAVYSKVSYAKGWISFLFLSSFIIATHLSYQIENKQISLTSVIDYDMQDCLDNSYSFSFLSL